jgi:hypothetical protein
MMGYPTVSFNDLEMSMVMSEDEITIEMSVGLYAKTVNGTIRI